MVDERDSGRLYGCHLSLIVGLLCTVCSLYNSNYSEKTVRFSRCLFGVISFPCVVDVCYLFPKTKNTVRGLWVPSVDAIVDRRNWGFLILYRRCVGGRFVTFSGSTSWVLPRGVGFFEFVRIGEVACTDPLPSYVEVVFLVLVCRSVWLYGGMVDFDRIESGCLLISCRLMVSLAVCIHTLQKRKDLGEFRFCMKVFNFGLLCRSGMLLAIEQFVSDVTTICLCIFLLRNPYRLWRC